jgi:hypothetical protein
MVEWFSPTAKDWAGNPQTLRSTFDHIDKRTIQMAKDIESLKASIAELRQLLADHVAPDPTPDPSPT